MKRKRQEGGQVALVVLLVSAVVLTLGLSMSKRAVVETRIDANEELLKKAFNAAESGIDYYLGTGEVGLTMPDGSEARVSLRSLGGGSQLDYDELVTEKEAALFWLAGHDDEGNIDFGDFYEGTDLELCLDNSFEGSVHLGLFYQQTGEMKIKRAGYNLGTGETVSGFADAAGTADDSCGEGKKLINISGLLEPGTVPVLLGVKPIFASTNLRLSGSADFPIQGEEIKSEGEVAGGVRQKVRLFERYKVPWFMLGAVTAGGSVLSN